MCNFFSCSFVKLRYMAYPPQRSAYPPQRSAYPPQQSVYSPQQSEYPPQQLAPPLDQSSVVIMQQPKATMKRTWNNKLCGCFDDCNVCKYGRQFHFDVWWLHLLPASKLETALSNPEYLILYSTYNLHLGWKMYCWINKSYDMVAHAHARTQTHARTLSRPSMSTQSELPTIKV